MAFTPRDFAEINEAFEARFPDTAVFEGTMFNYFKIGQHAHSFEMTTASDKLLPKGSLGPWWFFATKQRIKTWRKSTVGFPPNSKKDLILEGERTLQTAHGNIGPITARIREELTEVSWWDTKGTFLREAEYSTLNFNSSQVPLDGHLRAVYFDLRAVFRKVKETMPSYQVFHHYFESALLVFFESYRKWYGLLKSAKPKRIFFICHYHNEGLIAACKHLGIQTTELQHGLISTRDIYYVYPSRFKAAYGRAMFPDELWVFGRYWKDLFKGSAEETSGRITVVGDYRFERLQPEEGKREQAFVLCAQKNLHEPYIEYIRRIKKSVLPLHSNWKMIVKMHPLERRQDLYFAEANSQVEVLPVSSPLSDVLNRCHFQVSIYSTTFFDALAYKLPNFALTNTGYSNDYVNEMVGQCVALPLCVEDDPIAYYSTGSWEGKLLLASEVFSDFKI